MLDFRNLPQQNLERLLAELQQGDGDDRRDYIDRWQQLSFYLIGMQAKDGLQPSLLHKIGAALDQLASDERVGIATYITRFAIAHQQHKLAAQISRLAELQDEEVDYVLTGPSRGDAGVKDCYPVDVAYITTLNYIGQRQSAYHQFNQGGGHKAVYGMVRVNVPVRRMYGYIGRGTARQELLDRSKIRRDKKYVLEGVVQPLQRKEFLNQVADPSSDLFVFAHGWNQSFADSVIHAAQLCADLQEISGRTQPLRLTPLVLSWPSVMWYQDALQAAEAAGKVFASELDLIAEIQAKRRHLIAHSMGCRLAFGLLERAPKAVKASLFSNLVLASPDVQIVDFNRRLEVEGGSYQRAVTFGNSGDKVLLLATMLDALSTPRAGLCPGDVGHGETVDTGLFPPASLVRFPVEGLFRHSDFSSVAIGRLNAALAPA